MKKQYSEKIKKIDFIEAVGVILNNYRLDLTFIKSFQESKNEDWYLSDKIGGFRAFLKEFKVIRNVKEQKTNQLLDFLLKNDTLDVDKFLEDLKVDEREIIPKTHDMISLSSKVLFLKFPTKIYPLDNLAKMALGFSEQKKIEYKEYKEKIYDFIKFNQTEINNNLNLILEYLIEIEKDFEEIISIEEIRKKRFIDTILWTIGRNMSRYPSK